MTLAVLRGPSLAKIVRSDAAYAVLSAISKIIGRVGTFVIIAPIIGPAAQGTIVITSAWSATFLLLVNYGLGLRALRLVAKAPNDAAPIVRGDFKAMVALFVVSFAIAGVLIWRLFEPDEMPVFWLIFIGTLASVVADYCSAIFRALKSFAEEALLSLVGAAMQVVLSVLAAVMFDSLVLLAAAIMVSRVLSLWMSLWRMFKKPSFRSVTDRKSAPILSTLRENLPYALDSAFSVVLSQIDVILLSALTDRHVVGIYAAGSRLVQLIVMVPAIATNVMVPALARVEDKPQFQSHVERFSAVMISIAIAGSLFIFLGGPLFTNYILGSEYNDLYLLWPILSVLVISRLYEGFHGILLLSVGRMFRKVGVQAVSIVFICLGTLLAVGALGSAGLVLTLIVTYAGVGGAYMLGSPLPTKYKIASGTIAGFIVLLGVLTAIIPTLL